MKLIFTLLLWSTLTCLSGDKQRVDIPSKNTLKVIFVKIESDQKMTKMYNNKLHFSLMENGENDLLYFGVKHGGVYPQMVILFGENKKEIEIHISKKENGKKIKSWKVLYQGGLTYSGTLINIGDVVNKDELNDYSTDFYVEKITCSIK